MKLQERKAGAGAPMAIVDEQHAVADERFTAGIEETIWETRHMKGIGENISRIHPVKLSTTYKCFLR
ncbi:hypothetical protein ACVIW2_002394 [Bradyrhizobium huanghuaihaiense]|uniref:Uncharacterized protein n=1 Tax=Bradyrhizobium huanghuaihaiense TaxID=990078 RepID=A0A562R6G2_9BRAD|nr:hypothetical protein [Bradyrhizobium huanghuaihaiense]TWI64672.1 hypothetical protein IQ16_05731 [Bradyrhizobium huanghuaihaiense]